METVVHNIRDLTGHVRSAAEQLVGHALGEDQQLVIKVVDIAAPSPSGEATVSPIPGIPEAWKIYSGLSDDRIDELDQAIRQRADLSREFE